MEFSQTPRQPFGAQFDSLISLMKTFNLKSLAIPKKDLNCHQTLTFSEILLQCPKDRQGHRLQQSSVVKHPEKIERREVQGQTGGQNSTLENNSKTEIIERFNKQLFIEESWPIG